MWLTKVSDAWLKRAVKFLIKRTLGSLLRGEVDLDSLNISIGEGALELNSVLLNCDYINEQLGSTTWEVVAGYVGTVKVIVPITSLYKDSVQLQLVDAHLTIRPCSAGDGAGAGQGPNQATPPGSAADPGVMMPDEMDDMAGLGQQFSIQNGITLIAGGIENVLQRLCVEAKNTTICVELPKSGPLQVSPSVFLRLGSFAYTGHSSPSLDAQLPASSAPCMQLQKSAVFSNLTIELVPDAMEDSAAFDLGASIMDGPPSLPVDPGESSGDVVVCGADGSGAGCGGKLSLQLRWQAPTQLHPHITADLQLDPVKVQLDADHLVLLTEIATSLPKGPSRASPRGHRETHLGTSLLESVLLPNTVPLATEFVSRSWRYGDAEAVGSASGLDADADDFRDATSMFGSMQTSFSSFLTSAAASMRGGGEAAPPARGDTQRPPGVPTADHHEPEWRVEARVDDATLVLLYGARPDAPPPSGVSCSGVDYHPRLCVECGHMVAAAGGSGGDGWEMTVSLHGLEAFENLPVSGADIAEASAMLREITRIPSCLPPAPGGLRPEPTFAGIINPMEGHPSMYSSTLSQLSSATNASFQPMPAAAMTSRIQISPVLLCMGSRHVTSSAPSVSITIRSGKLQTSRGLQRVSPNGRPDVDVLVRVRPVTFWLTFPLLHRLSAFFEPLAALQTAAEQARAAARAAAPQPGWHGLPNQHHHLSGMASIFGNLQNLQGDLLGVAPPAKRRMSAHVDVLLPHVCVLLLLPSGVAENRPCHGYSCLAIDMFSLPSEHVPLGPASSEVPFLSASTGTAGTPTGVWDADLALSRVKIYLVGNPFADLDFTISHHLDATPKATCIIDMLPPGPEAVLPMLLPGESAERAARTALHVGVHVMPEAQPDQFLADDAWDRVRAHAADSRGGMSWEDTIKVIGRSHASATITVNVCAPAMLIDVSKADVVALCDVGEALKTWVALLAEQAQAALDPTLPPPPPLQTVLEVDAGFKCNISPSVQGTDLMLDDRSAAKFLIDADRTHIFVATALGGRESAVALCASIEGVRVDGGEPRASLVLCPPSQEDSLLAERGPRFELMCVQRPSAKFGEASLIPRAASPPPPDLFRQDDSLIILPPTEKLASLAIRGATLAAPAGDLTLPWALQLASFFSDGVSQGGAGAAGTPAEATGLEMSLRLEDCAVRYEPPPPPSEADAASAASPVSAAILVGSAHWSSQGNELAQEVELRTVSVFCAESSGRGPDWTPDMPRDLPAAHLLGSGFACVAQEGRLTITLRQPEELGGTTEVEIRNERLHSTLNPVSASLAVRLLTQIAEAHSDAGPSAGGTGRVPHGAAGRGTSYRPPASPRRTANAVHAATRAHVLDGLQDDFDSDGRSPEWRLGPQPAVAQHSEHVRSDSEDAAPDEYQHNAYPPDLEEDGTFRESNGRWLPADDGSVSEGVVSSGMGGPPRVIENFIPELPPQGRTGPGGGPPWGGGGGRPPFPLPESYPDPRFRLVVHDVRALVALCGRDADSPAGEGGSRRLELQLDGVWVQADSFGEDGPHARRLVVAVRSAELRDCAVRADSPFKKWRKVLSVHAASRCPRQANACLVQVELEAVRPDGSTGVEELRLSVAALPLRLRLDQNVVDFLLAFSASPTGLSFEDGELVNYEDALEEEWVAPRIPEPDAESDVFFQRCEIRGLTIEVDYWPRRVNVTSLRAGNLVELLNLAPLKEVELSLPSIRLNGLQGWPVLATTVAESWLRHIISSQVHNFLKGFPAVASVARVGSAAGTLLSIPMDQLRGREASSGAPLSRQIQRGLTGLVRAILAEFLGVTANALGGVQVILEGSATSSGEQPAGVSDGLRLAADRLGSGLRGFGKAIRSPFKTEGISGGVRAIVQSAPRALAAPLGGAVGAGRAVLVGARNALDPERYESRRLANM